MSKLTALKKQIAALEAQAERIAKAEMSSAIAKVKEIMSEFNLTIEHLTQTVTGKRATKKTKVKTASVAKYADPKTGKTWSGFGRAPGWIAGAKNRDAFLVDKSSVKAADPVAIAPTTVKKAVKTAKAVKVAKAGKVAKKASKPAAKKATAVAPAPAAAAAKKKPAAKKVVAKKAPAKKAARKAMAPAPSEAVAAPAA